MAQVMRASSAVGIFKLKVRIRAALFRHRNASLLTAGETDNQRDTTMPDQKPGSPAPNKESKGMPVALRRIEKVRRERTTVLDLSRLGLTSVPEQIGQLTALQHLNLSGNKLTVVPEILGQLTALQWLELDENRLAGVLDMLGRMTVLQRLKLRSNQLTGLPDALGATNSAPRDFPHREQFL
jgi:Leucine-rich repeat (LRR) protein